jgi:hypothetical protein
MGDRMENLNERLINQTQKIRFIDRKSTTCGKYSTSTGLIFRKQAEKK